MSRTLTLPSVRLCAAAKIAAASLCADEKTPFCAIDVGCDHAKLSVFLVQSGLCNKVYACDINDGPLEKARRTLSLRSYKGKNLDNYIDVIKTDGLSGMENTCAQRIFILGMGGELIANIIDNASFLKAEQNKGKIGLVLQAMTSVDDLRKYLYADGFEIRNEKLVLDKGRIYSVMLCVYDGKEREGTQAEYLLGKCNIENGGELFKKELDRRIRITESALSQLENNAMTDAALKELHNQLITIKEGVKL